MAGVKTLKKAQKEQNDEWYTQLDDIEAELKNYRKYMNGKTVLCNCDDPFESNFFKYFAMNFNQLGLKKLIATCYGTSPIVYTQLNIFGEEEVVATERKGRKAYKIEITEVKDENGDGAIDLADVEYLIKNKKNILTLLDGDGDFRSAECIELLKEADLVVTNPPFSLSREYISQLLEFDKKFILMCRLSTIHYKEVFPEIQNNNMWVGYGFNLSVVYKTPYENTEESNRKFVKGKGYDPNDGYVKVPAICWLTNIDIQKRHEPYIFTKSIKTTDYVKYENLDAIDVGKVSDIPDDYYGLMGVPDTFLDCYNPEQFEIVGLGVGNLAKQIGVKKNYRGRTDVAYKDKNGKDKCPFSRIIIRRIDNENSNE